MNRFQSKLLIAFILLLLTSCASSTLNKAEKKGAIAQNAQEVFDLSNENTLRLVSSDFDSYIFFSQDGSLSAKSIFNNNGDHGIWDITDGGKLCIKFNVWYYGDINCYSSYNDPDNSDQFLFFTRNGALAYTVTATSGNSQHIKVITKKDRKTNYVRRTISEGQSVQTADPAPAQSTPDPAPVSVSTNKGSSESREEVQHTVKSMAQNCPDCNFEDADLRQAHLVGANLKGANLKGADLSHANLRRANLKDANLKGATLISTNLPGANFRDADLRGADFTGSNLIRADFTGADMEGCIFENTLQEGVKGL